MVTIADILADRYGAKEFCITLTGKAIATGIEKSFYFSRSGFITEPSDTPANQYFKRALGKPLVFNRKLTGDLRLGGTSRADFGILELIDVDGSLDYLNDYNFAGGRVFVQVGGKNLPFDQFHTILDGVAESVQVQQKKVVIRPRSKSFDFDVPLQPVKYAGDNVDALGIEGTASDIAGNPKIITLGQRNVVKLVKVNAPAQIYQGHAGKTKAITNVRDNGVPLAETTDYTLDLDSGTITTVSPAGGIITADVQGDNTDDVYPNTVAGICKYIATNVVGLTYPDDFDVASFEALPTEVVGFSTTAETTAAVVMDILCQSIGAYWFITRNNKLKIIQWTAPTAPADWTFAAHKVASIKKVAVGDSSKGTPDHKILLGYDVIDALGDNDIAGSVSDADRAYLTAEIRTKEIENSSVLTIFPNATQLEITTALVTEAAAAAEGLRQLVLWSVRHDIFQITLSTAALQINLGDVVNITHHRFGLNAGRNLRVFRARDQLKRNQVILWAWG